MIVYYLNEDKKLKTQDCVRDSDGFWSAIIQENHLLISFYDSETQQFVERHHFTNDLNSTEKRLWVGNEFVDNTLFMLSDAADYETSQTRKFNYKSKLVVQDGLFIWADGMDLYMRAQGAGALEMLQMPGAALYVGFLDETGFLEMGIFEVEDLPLNQDVLISGSSAWDDATHIGVKVEISESVVAVFAAPVSSEPVAVEFGAAGSFPDVNL